MGCDAWKRNLSFYHAGEWWVLCVDCWEDYWLNTDELADDYKPPINHKKKDKVRI